MTYEEAIAIVCYFGSLDRENLNIQGSGVLGIHDHEVLKCNGTTCINCKLFKENDCYIVKETATEMLNLNTTAFNLQKHKNTHPELFI